MEHRKRTIGRGRGCVALLAALALAAPGFAQSGSIDPAFTIGTGAGNRIFAMAQQPDGFHVIGGSFTSYNGTSLNRLARITRTGTLDMAFTIGTGTDGQVNAIAIDQVGRILIGGTFTTYNGVSRSGVARLNSDGTLDATFATGTGFSGGVVNGLAVQADGKVIAVGTFSGYNGSTANKVVRLGTTGALDGTFNVGTGPNAAVYAVSLDAAGRAVIGGGFATVNGTSRPGIARLTTTGAVDVTFDPGSGVNNSVFAVRHAHDGRILIGGMFTNYDGSSVGRIARVLADGSYDTSFSTGTGFNSWVYTITEQSDGRLLAGGDFTSYNGNARNRLIRLEADGSVDTGFNIGSGCSNWVYAITWQSEGKVTVAGGFTSYNGTSRNRLVRLLSDCDETLELVVNTDAFGAQTSWELLGEGYTYPVCGGSGFASSTETTVTCCVPNGKFRLRVLDSAGDGMTTGGYVLKDGSGQRIIDNHNDGVFTYESSIASGGTFDVPLGTVKPIFTACDKLDWVYSQFMVIGELPAVSAQWGVGDQTDDGYEFWYYDPDGSYSHRRFRSHATSDGFGVGALRACHQRLSWYPHINPIPVGVLLNVKVRGRVNGENLNWGPACRFKLDPVAAACPTTQLMNIPGNRYFSCGVTKPRNKYVTAVPVPMANLYEFEFTNTGLGYTKVISSTTYHRYLNWTLNPLIPGQTYQVRVRVSLDGGVTFCPYGEPCSLTIAPTFQGGGSSQMVFGEEVGVHVWPNPTTGDRIDLGLTGLQAEDAPVMLTVFDASGRVMHQEAITPEVGQWQGTLSFQRQLPAGAYFLRIAQDGDLRTERFLVAH